MEQEKKFNSSVDGIGSALEKHDFDRSLPKELDVSGESGFRPLKKVVKLFKDSFVSLWQGRWNYILFNIVPRILGFLPLIIIVSLVIAFGLWQAAIGNLDEFTFNATNITLTVLVFAGLLFAFIYGIFWSQAAYVYYLNSRAETAGNKQILKSSFKLTFGLFWVSLLQALVVLAGLILFVIPGIIWLVRFALAPFAYVVEGKKGAAALKRSAELSKNYRWSFFLRIILMQYLLFFIQAVFSVIFFLINFYNNSDIGNLVITALLLFIVGLINLFISLLLEPLQFVFMFDIFNNLVAVKNTVGSRDSFKWGKKLLIILLVLVLPILTMGFNDLVGNFDFKRLFLGISTDDNYVDLPGPFDDSSMVDEQFNEEEFEKDSDGDEIPDFLESLIGTDPDSKDTDGDGLTDDQELEKGSDPLNR